MPIANEASDPTLGHGSHALLLRNGTGSGADVFATHIRWHTSCPVVHHGEIDGHGSICQGSEVHSIQLLIGTSLVVARNNRKQKCHLDLNQAN